jgi:sec-independent protein translocase protein TatC
MFHFFAATTPKGVAMMTDISQYLNFVLVMFVAFGAAFEVPVAVVLLVVMNLVTVQKLRSIRGYVLLGSFIVAAFITPPDAVSQSIMALPMYLLYETGVIMASVLVRPKPDTAGEGSGAPS